MGLLQKPVRDYTPQDRAALKKPLGVTGRPYPMRDSVMVDGGTLQARVHIAIARRLYDLRAAAEHAAAGLALAQRADDPGLTAEALVAKLRLDFYTGRGLDVGLGERAMELEQQARPPRVWDRAAMALGICLKQSDRFDEARHAAEEIVAELRASWRSHEHD